MPRFRNYSLRHYRSMTKVPILLFLSALTLTVVTNYFNFEANIVPSQLNEFPSSETSPWLLYRMMQNREDYNKRNKTETEIAFEVNYPLANCTNVTIENESWGGKLRKTFTVLLDFIPAAGRQISCEDPLITLTTHGDYRYLDNLIPIVERWRGPVSVALYVPYEDLTPTLVRISYIRECTSDLVKEWISFHLYSPTRYFHHTRDEVWRVWEKSKFIDRDLFCSRVPSFSEAEKSSRNFHKLRYPVNLGRNIAREGAKTRYILASDIELFPSVDFVPRFFQMLGHNQDYFQNRSNPYVFVLPIFEIEENYDLPDTKEQLIDLIQGNVGIPFHKFVCPECHTIPKYEEWLVADNSSEDRLNVFHVAKRKVPYSSWEPIYVSTNDVPLYDERLSWEGLRDKMSQSYAMCLLDYDFMILDNAFLLHKPGIKRKRHNMKRPSKSIQKQNRILAKVNREITKKYGQREGCVDSS